MVNVYRDGEEHLYPLMRERERIVKKLITLLPVSQIIERRDEMNLEETTLLLILK